MSYFDTESNDFTFEDLHPGPGPGPVCACINCGATRASGADLSEFWPDDQPKPIVLCDDCAAEVRRIERYADELAKLPSCDVRAKIIDDATTTRGLVHALTAHDQSGCVHCYSVRKPAAAAIASEIREGRAA